MQTEINPTRERSTSVKAVKVIIIVVTSTAYLSINWIEKVGRPVTPGLAIPFAYIYSMVPVSFAFIVLYEIREIVLRISSFKNRIK